MTRLSIQQEFHSFVAELVHVANERNIKTVPTEDFSFSWWERVSHESKQLRTQIQSSLSLKVLFSEVFKNSNLSERLDLLERRTREYEKELGWVHFFLASAWNLLRDYFENGTRLGLTINHEAIEQTLDRYFQALEKPIIVVSTLVWSDFDAEAEFDLDETITFRRIKASDYPILGRETALPRDFGGRSVRYPSSDEWMTLVKVPVSTPMLSVPHECLQRVVMAVALSTAGRAEARIESTQFENAFQRGYAIHSGGPLRTSRVGKPVLVTREDIEKCRRRYDLLKRIDDDNRFKYLRVSLRRLRASTARDLDEDMLVDLIVGLESLFAPDSQTTEVTFRFRLRGAAILPSKDFGDPHSRLTFLRELYEARSRVVHGQSVENLRELSTRAELALKSAFLWFAEHPRSLDGADKIVRLLDAQMVSVLEENTRQDIPEGGTQGLA